MALIVVGVDGSEEAEGAFRFAAVEAALRGAKLRVVCAWHVPSGALSAGWTPSVDMTSGFEAGARDVLAQAVAEAASLEPDVVCEERLVEGEARTCCCGSRKAQTCSSSARGGSAASRASCSARSVSTSSTRRPARSWSFLTGR